MSLINPASFNGLLLVNKPENITSHDVVQRVRRVFGTREVGHAGTLDPLATGLMVLLIGDGTKISDYILNGDKAYKVRVKLGVRTDSLDIQGQVVSQVAVDLTEQRIRTEALALQGTFLWPVPAISAVKIQGKKMYEWTRDTDVIMEPPKKEMSYWNLVILSVGPDYLEASVECSKGSFIRSWAAELGERLGVGGSVEKLERTSSQPYHLENAVNLEFLEVGSEAVERLTAQAYIPIRRALPDWRAVTIKGKDVRLILNGQVSHDLERRLIVEQRTATLEQRNVGIKVLSAETGGLLALIEAQPNRGLKIRRVFKNT